MPKWYYTKKELKENPSVLNGLDSTIESRYRREGARFIMELGTTMNLSLQSTMATAVVFYHRFYMKHTFQDFPRYPTACACLFLAGKVEETPKKCRDMIENAKKLLTEPKFAEQFGNDLRTQLEEVMTLERILLQSIKFDLQLEHPYKYLLKYAQSLKGDKARLERMVQMAWNFVNDSLCTTLCLQWEPEIIAIALMYLACKLSKFEVVDWNGRQSEHFRWWDMYVEDMSIDVLEDICHQVLDFYSQVKSPGNSSGSGTPTNPPSNSTPVTRRTDSSNSLTPSAGTPKTTSPYFPSPSQPSSTSPPNKLNQPAIASVRNYHSSSLPSSPGVQMQQQQLQNYHHRNMTGVPPPPISNQYLPQPHIPVQSVTPYNYAPPNNGMLPMMHHPPPPMMHIHHQPPMPSHFPHPPPAAPPPPPQQPPPPPPPS